MTNLVERKGNFIKVRTLIDDEPHWIPVSTIMDIYRESNEIRCATAHGTFNIAEYDSVKEAKDALDGIIDELV